MDKLSTGKRIVVQVLFETERSLKSNYHKREHWGSLYGSRFELVLTIQSSISIWWITWDSIFRNILETIVEEIGEIIPNSIEF